MISNKIVILPKQEKSLRVVNILTKKVAKRKFEDPIVLGFITHNTVRYNTYNNIMALVSY